MAEKLRLIVVDDSSNYTESISSLLRNAGYAVLAERVEDKEDFIEALSNSVWDLIATTPDNPQFSAFETLELLQRRESDVPLVIFSDNEESEIIGKLFDAGAKDVICLSRPQHAVHTLLREVEVSRLRQHMNNIESMLGEANHRAQMLVDSAHDAITYVHEGMHIYANQAYLEMFGYESMDEIEGMPIMSMVEKKDQASLKKFLRGYSKSKITTATQDVTGVKTDGTSFKITMEFSPASYEQERCTQIIIQVQANNEELEKKLDDMSKIDQLTNTYNRRYLFDNLQPLCGVKGVFGAFLCITPDNLKHVREAQGIHASDVLLVEFAKHLQQYIAGEKDFLARFEGGKFGMVIHGCDQQQAEEFANRLVHESEDIIIDLGKESTTTTLSIGVSLFNDALADYHEVITRAERANSEVANEAGNGVVVFIPSEEEMQQEERVSIISREIKEAIRGNKLQLYYQPIISLKDDPHETYQILLRMPQENGEFMSTTELVDSARDANLLVALDRWVIAHAIKSLTERRRSGALTKFFVKISDATIKEPAKFLPWLKDICTMARLQPGILTFEIHDEVARDNLKSLKLISAGLKKLHINLSLDHFGTEINFQNILKHIDATYLKLDVSIVSKLASDQRTLDKVKEITTIAAEGRRQVIAHGVEDPHTLAAIYSTGIDYIDGYFLQEPSPEMDYDFSE